MDRSELMVELADAFATGAVVLIDANEGVEEAAEVTVIVASEPAKGMVGSIVEESVARLVPTRRDSVLAVLSAATVAEATPTAEGALPDVT